MSYVDEAKAIKKSYELRVSSLPPFKGAKGQSAPGKYQPTDEERRAINYLEVVSQPRNGTGSAFIRKRAEADFIFKGGSKEQFQEIVKYEDQQRGPRGVGANIASSSSSTTNFAKPNFSTGGTPSALESQQGLVDALKSNKTPNQYSRGGEPVSEQERRDIEYIKQQQMFSYQEDAAQQAKVAAIRQSAIPQTAIAPYQQNRSGVPEFSESFNDPAFRTPEETKLREEKKMRDTIQFADTGVINPEGDTRASQYKAINKPVVLGPGLTLADLKTQSTPKSFDEIETRKIPSAVSRQDPLDISSPGPYIPFSSSLSVLGVETLKVPPSAERKAQAKEERANLSNFIREAKAGGATEVIIKSGGEGKLVKLSNLNRELVAFKRGLPEGALVTITVPEGMEKNLSKDLSLQTTGNPFIDVPRQALAGLTAPVENVVRSFVELPRGILDIVQGKVTPQTSTFGVTLPSPKAPETKETPIGNILNLKSPATGKGPVYDISATIGEAALIASPLAFVKRGGGKAKTSAEVAKEPLDLTVTARKTPTYRNTNPYRDFYEVQVGKTTTKPNKNNIFEFDDLVSETAFTRRRINLGTGLGATLDDAGGLIRGKPPSSGPGDVSDVLFGTKGGGTFQQKKFPEPKEVGNPASTGQQTLQKQKPVTKQESLLEPQRPTPVKTKTKAQLLTDKYLEELTTGRKRRLRQREEYQLEFTPTPTQRQRVVFVPELSLDTGLEIKVGQGLKGEQLSKQKLIIPTVFEPPAQRQRLSFDILQVPKATTKQNTPFKTKQDPIITTGFPTIFPPTTRQTTTQRNPPIFPPFKFIGIPPLGGGYGLGGGPKKPRRKSFDIYSVNPERIGAIAQAGIQPLSSSSTPDIFGKVEKKLKKSSGKRPKGMKKGFLEDPLGFG